MCFLKQTSLNTAFAAGPNIAFNQRALQSPGVLANGYADLAVDGNPSNQLSGFPSSVYAHTEFSDTVASWTFILDQAYNITGILLLNRKSVGMPCFSQNWYNFKTFKTTCNSKHTFANYRNLLPTLRCNIFKNLMSFKETKLCLFILFV